MSGASRPASVLLAWSAFAVTVALFGGTMLITALDPHPREAGGAGVAIGWLAYSVVGAVISTRRPGDRIGALLLGMALSGEVGMLSERGLTGGISGGSPVVTLAQHPLAMWVVPLLVQTWVVSFTLLGVLLLIFPTGRSLSSGWRPILWVAFAMIPVGMATAGTSRTDPLAVSLSTFPLLEVLFGPETGRAVGDIGRSVSGMSQLALFILAAASLILRYRRARGVERQQLKWLAYAALLFAVVLVGTVIIFFSPLRALDPDAPIPAAVFDGIPFVLALIAIPMAVGVAILRYRLYDIDVLMNRTLVYGAVTALLIGTYATGVVLLQAILRPFTAGSDLAVAASTLLVVALFQPLRRWVQDAVDRRFYRSRYDAVRTLDSFAARLRDEVELDAVRADLLAAVGEAMRPAHASLWLRRP